MTTTPENSGASSASRDVANLGLVRPPLVYLISLVSGFVIHLAVPLSFLPVGLAVPLGVPLVAVAIGLFYYSVAKFRAAGTPVPARKPTTAIVRTGPYRFSRNPDLSCVLPIPTRYRHLGQQRVAAGYTRRSGGADAHCRHTKRRAVPRTEIRCAILGI